MQRGKLRPAQPPLERSCICPLTASFAPHWAGGTPGTPRHKQERGSEMFPKYLITNLKVVEDMFLIFLLHLVSLLCALLSPVYSCLKRLNIRGLNLVMRQVIWEWNQFRHLIIRETAQFFHTCCIKMWHMALNLRSSPADSRLWDAEALFDVGDVDSAGLAQPAAPQLAALPSAAPGPASLCSAPAALCVGLRSGANPLGETKKKGS